MVELKAGGRVYKQPLTVSPDPRLTLPAAAYARQFALARDIERARAEIAMTLKEAESRHAGADARVRAITDAAPEKRSPDSIWAAPTTVEGLRYLGTAFKSLAQAVDGADAAPTPDVERGYARHRALLDAALAKWAKLGETSAPRANAP